MSLEEPIYNIGVVSRMTDIPPATLRIWERRYDFPNAARTEGRHRLYSEAEVQRLRWVKARIDQGMQTRQAIRALASMEEESRPMVVNHISHPQTSTSEVPDREPGEDSYIHILQTRLYRALLDHDTGLADQVFNEAQALYPLEDIVLHMIRPTLFEIGEDWAQGDVQIATEHLATQYVRQWLLTWIRTGPPPYAVPSTVLACAPDEWHEGGLLMLGALLRRRRWPIAYLGQSTPLPALAEFVEAVRPLAIVISATSEASAEALLEWPTALPDAARMGQPIVSYGGRIFNLQPEWRAKVPGIFLGATLNEGVETLDRLLQNATSE